MFGSSRASGRERRAYIRVRLGLSVPNSKIVREGEERDLQDPTGKQCQLELFNESIVPEHLSMMFRVLSLGFRFSCV